MSATVAGPGGTFDGALYATATAHHRAHDAASLGGLVLAAGEHVLDLGCGVGDLTLRLWDAVQPGGSVVGLDVSASVLATAARSAGERDGLSWVRSRAQDLADAVAPASVDAVVSVAALHWVPGTDQAGVLDAVASALRPGGRLRLDMGGRGQLAEVFAVLDDVSAAHGGAPCPLFFPDAQGYAALLGGAGLVVQECVLVPQRRDLGSADGVEAWLRSQVLPAYLPDVEPQRRDAFAEQALARVLRATPDHVVDYVRLQASAVRPR